MRVVNSKTINVIYRPKKHVDENVKKLLNRFFKIAQIVFTFDMGFFRYSSNRVKLLFRFLSVVQCFSMSLICIYFFAINLNIFSAIWNTIYVLQYVAYFVSYTFTRKDLTYHEYLKELLSVDSVLGIDIKSHKVILKVISAFLASISLRCFLTILYCSYFSYCARPLIILVIYVILIIDLDFILFSNFSIFYSTYCRLVKFPTLLLDLNTDVAATQLLFKTLIDLFEKIKKSFDLVYLCALLFNVPVLLISIYGSLAYFKSIDVNEAITNMCVGYISLIQTLTIIYSPALCAHALSSQVDKMKIILHDRLLHEEDATRIMELKRFIRYLEARPLKYCVCNIIPLDLSLPLNILKLCITYVIVIIQFTHLY